MPLAKELGRVEEALSFSGVAWHDGKEEVLSFGGAVRLLVVVQSQDLGPISYTTAEIRIGKQKLK